MFTLLSLFRKRVRDPAASQVRPAIGTALHPLHPMGRCHAPAGEAVASLLAGLLLRWRLAARTDLIQTCTPLMVHVRPFFYMPLGLFEVAE